MRSVAVAISFVALVGCAPKVKQVYEGPPIADQVTLTASNRNVRITRVDGRRLADFVEAGMTGYAFETVYLLPSKKHTVMLHVIGGAWVADGELWFVGEPGRTYVAKYRRADDDRVQLWIEEEWSGRRVGGIPGSEDEPK